MTTHSDLVKIGAKWLKTQHSSREKYPQVIGDWRHSGCGVILTEFVSFEQSIPDVIGFNNHCSIVIECKVSHADYLADLKKTHRFHLNPKQCGNYRYYLTLPEIIKPDEVNNGWGLLYYDGKVHVKKPSTLHCEPEVKVAEYSLLYSIARRASDKNMLEQILKPYTQCKLCHKVVEEWEFIKYTGNVCLKCYEQIKSEEGK